MLRKSEHSFTNIFILVTLFNFFLAACLGLMMRYAFVWEASWMKYKNIMHAHSHVALLGWLYPMLIILLWKALDQNISSKYFTILFCLTEISVLGMLLSFSFDGYGSFSMVFLLLFIIVSYFILYKLWRSLSGKTGGYVLLLKTSVVWFFLSTIGLWAMGPILSLKISQLYYMAIQFFLHFQLNGWLLFAVLALFFHQLRISGIAYSRKYFRIFYYTLIVSTLLTFAQAVTWANPETLLFAANSFGVVLQLFTLFVFFKLINREIIRQFTSRLQTFALWMYGLALLSLIIKIGIQTVVVFPEIAVISYTIRLYVLGFIHLITLGMVTAYIVGYGISAGYISYKNKLSATGWVLVFAGFIVTELILFGQGTLVWFGYGYIGHYHLMLFLASILFPLGIMLSMIGQRTPTTQNFSLNKLQL